MRRGAAGALFLGAVFSLHVSPSPMEAQAVRGRLLDMAARTPIVLARLTLLDVDRQEVGREITDSQGRFLLTAPGPGPYWIEIESPFHEGFSEGPITLGGADTVSLSFELMPRPVELDDLTVETEGRSRRLALEGVYQRREAGIGVHVDEDRIRARPGTKVSDLIALLPMVELYDDPTEEAVRVVFRRRQFESLLIADGKRPPPCFPQVFLDGAVLAIGGEVPGGLDRFPVNSLQGVEVYESPAGLPGRFSGPNAHCGTIVLWTR